ncbi:ORF014 modified RING finger protein [Bovine papular stomatitis virus]|uniref:ORF014 modified RING finger protein n=1 Tax=Bovine papular stomatitis virus TaxID=129727 RepID=Q6TVH4_9POXV|nr:ORF014 modified RING finger protein [Bovine papular stomatitis virus]AAR98371.1 ORF014 modified RING finger protein [Bovine papular stomatitis virus]
MPIKVKSWKVAVKCSLACPPVCYICSKKASEGCLNAACPGACPFVVMVCGHGYHRHCLGPANTDVCFVCRSVLQKADIPDETASDAVIREFML